MVKFFHRLHITTSAGNSNNAKTCSANKPVAASRPKWAVGSKRDCASSMNWLISRREIATTARPEAVKAAGEGPDDLAAFALSCLKLMEEMDGVINGDAIKSFILSVDHTRAKQRIKRAVERVHAFRSVMGEHSKVTPHPTEGRLQ